MEKLKNLFFKAINTIGFKNPNKTLKIEIKQNMTNTLNTVNTSTIYKRVEKNISKIGPKTYRVRVGKLNKCVPTRQEARNLKRAWLVA